MPETVLGYWGTRGLAGACRLALAYAGEEFEDKKYKDIPQSLAEAMVKKVDMQGAEGDWFTDKRSLDLPFSNIPYLLIDGRKITQSHAILRYICRKHGLVPKNEDDEINLDMYMEVLRDDFLGIIICTQCLFDPCAYTVPKDEYPAAKKNYIENTMKRMCKKHDDFLANKKYAVGDTRTTADFVAYELFDIHRIFVKGDYKEYPNIQRFLDAFESNDNIKKYLASGKFTRTPVFSPFSMFDK